MTDLTPRQAYDAMFLFLQEYWERGNKADEGIAGLLGNCAVGLWEGGTPDVPMTADPAMWHDWMSAVERVRSGEDPYGGVWKLEPPTG
jgi:hypothetical protein